MLASAIVVASASTPMVQVLLYHIKNRYDAGQVCKDIYFSKIQDLNFVFEKTDIRTSPCLHLAYAVYMLFTFTAPDFNRASIRFVS